MSTAVKHSIDEDFAAWADDTAGLIERREFDELDIADLVEEVRGLARSQLGAVRSHLKQLLLHLLKWSLQPARRLRSWRISIANARAEIADEFADSPSLRQKLTSERIHNAWLHACELAALETGLPESDFPERCPWDLDDQILKRDWLP